MSKKNILLLCLIVITLSGYLKSMGTNNMIPIEDRCYAVSQIWAISSKYYGFWEITNSDLDWDLEYQNAYAKVKNVKNNYDYFCVLKSFIANLQDVHADSSMLLPSSLFQDTFGFLPFTLEYFDGRFVVASTHDQNKYCIGDTIKQINGIDAENFFHDQYSSYYISANENYRKKMYARVFQWFGEKNTSYRIKAQGSDGIEKDWNIKRGAYRTNKTTFSGKTSPSLGEFLYESENFVLEQITPDILRLHILNFTDPDLVKEYENRISSYILDTRKIILDLRGNPGGNGNFAKKIVSSMIDCPVAEEKLKTSISSTLEMSVYKTGNSPNAQKINALGRQMAAGKYSIPLESYGKIMKYLGEDIDIPEAGSIIKYHGDKNLVVLVDFDTASASEYIASALQAMGIKLIGNNTRGCAGDTMKVDLDNGWSFPLSCIHNLTPTGEEIMGKGLIPDILTPITYDDFLNNKDTPLDTAIDVLKDSIVSIYFSPMGIGKAAVT